MQRVELPVWARPVRAAAPAVTQRGAPTQPAQARTLCDWVLHLLQLYSAYNLGQARAPLHPPQPRTRGSSERVFCMLTITTGSNVPVLCPITWAWCDRRAFDHLRECVVSSLRDAQADPHALACLAGRSRSRRRRRCARTHWRARTRTCVRCCACSRTSRSATCSTLTTTPRPARRRPMSPRRASPSRAHNPEPGRPLTNIVPRDGQRAADARAPCRARARSH
jgi:hypothetical protein